MALAGSEDDDKFLDAAWEIVVTVIGAVVVAAGAAIVSKMYLKWKGRQQRVN